MELISEQSRESVPNLLEIVSSIKHEQNTLLPLLKRNDLSPEDQISILLKNSKVYKQLQVMLIEDIFNNLPSEIGNFKETAVIYNYITKVSFPIIKKVLLTVMRDKDINSFLRDYNRAILQRDFKSAMQTFVKIKSSQSIKSLTLFALLVQLNKLKKLANEKYKHIPTYLLSKQERDLLDNYQKSLQETIRELEATILKGNYKKVDVDYFSARLFVFEEVDGSINAMTSLTLPRFDEIIKYRNLSLEEPIKEINSLLNKPAKRGSYVNSINQHLNQILNLRGRVLESIEHIVNNSVIHFTLKMKQERSNKKKARFYELLKDMTSTRWSILSGSVSEDELNDTIKRLDHYAKELNELAKDDECQEILRKFLPQSKENLINIMEVLNYATTASLFFGFTGLLLRASVKEGTAYLISKLSFKLIKFSSYSLLLSSSLNLGATISKVAKTGKLEKSDSLNMALSMGMMFLSAAGIKPSIINKSLSLHMLHSSLSFGAMVFGGIEIGKTVKKLGRGEKITLEEMMSDMVYAFTGITYLTYFPLRMRFSLQNFMEMFKSEKLIPEFAASSSERYTLPYNRELNEDFSKAYRTRVNASTQVKEIPIERIIKRALRRFKIQRIIRSFRNPNHEYITSNLKTKISVVNSSESVFVSIEKTLKSLIESKNIDLDNERVQAILNSKKEFFLLNDAITYSLRIFIDQPYHIKNLTLKDFNALRDLVEYIMKNKKTVVKLGYINGKDWNEYLTIAKQILDKEDLNSSKLIVILSGKIGNVKVMEKPKGYLFSVNDMYIPERNLNKRLKIEYTLYRKTEEKASNEVAVNDETANNEARKPQDGNKIGNNESKETLNNDKIGKKEDDLRRALTSIIKLLGDKDTRLEVLKLHKGGEYQKKLRVVAPRDDSGNFLDLAVHRHNIIGKNDEEILKYGGIYEAKVSDGYRLYFYVFYTTPKDVQSIHKGGKVNNVFVYLMQGGTKGQSGGSTSQPSIIKWMDNKSPGVVNQVVKSLGFNPSKRSSKK